MPLPHNAGMPLYAFDGTWNEAKDGDDPQYSNTNVVRFFEAYRRHSARPDLDFYLAGVGTRFGAVGRVLGGVFGLGELPRINEAYDRLCQAWDQGERDIDIVGFSARRRRTRLGGSRQRRLIAQLKGDFCGLC